MLRVEKIEALVWDMDGCLHSYIPFAQSLHHWNGAAVRAFNKVSMAAGILHNLSEEEIQKMAVDSFKTLGASTAVFSRDYNICERDMHLEFHREAVLEELIQSHAELPELFTRASHLKHIVLTHGSEEWAERCLEKSGIRDCFAEVISFEHVDMQKKSDSMIPFEKALSCAGLPADRVVMIEDTKKNLIIPKKMGMQTVFIEENGLEPEWIKMPTADDVYVDHSVRNAADLLKHLTAVPA